MRNYSIPEILIGKSGHVSNKDISFLLNRHAYNFKGQAHLNSFMFTMVLSGKKELLHAEGKITLEAGEAALLKQGEYVVSERFCNIQGEFTNFLLCFNYPEQGYSSSHIKEVSCITGSLCKVNAHPLTTGFGKNLCTYADHSPSLLKTLLPLKLKELFEVLKQSQPLVLRFLQTAAPPKPQSVVSIFEHNFTEKLTLSEYAHLCGLSLSTLKRKFKEETGDSPMRWIVQRRLNESCKIMTDRSLNISSIAFQVGFESLAHFSKAFSVHYGCSPSSFRKKLLS